MRGTGIAISRAAVYLLIVTLLVVTYPGVSLNPSRLARLTTQLKQPTPGVIKCKDDHPIREKISNVLAAGLAAMLFLPGVSHAGLYEKDHMSFQYPDDFNLSQKPVKTHKSEVLFKSSTVKGFQAGVTMDPVKVSSIREFASPEELASRVEAVEKAKDGVFTVDIVSATESTKPISGNAEVPAYTIEYKVDSSRGQNHYVVKTSIVNKKLYVFTVQCKEKNYDEVADIAKSIVDSLTIT